MTSHPALARRLSLTTAIFLGLGSMIGAGLFAAFSPAARAAGNGLLIGLAVAALVATFNALSTAQLAAAMPQSGGTYVYGRRVLGEWWGFIAGWGFVIGKTASCAAMALTFAAAVSPAGWLRPVAVAAVAAITLINIAGVTRTARATQIIVVFVLAAIAVAVAGGISAAGGSASQLAGFVSDGSLWSGGAYGILQSAGLLFFAFAGYARVATLGEEVRDPARTIPRAIIVALAVCVGVYAVVAVVLLSVLGSSAVAGSASPVVALAASSGWPWVEWFVRAGAAAASLGALLALVAGVSRTVLAMSRGGDLPAWLSAVHPRFSTPHRAEATVGLVLVLLVSITDLRGVIAFSSFGVLVYYVIANISAWHQDASERRFGRLSPTLGAALCVVLVVTLPVSAIVTGVAVFAVGAVYRAVRLRGAPTD
ncbi:APC family permease [Okibacterium fritillariae]|uniref:APC family permease n=1 Tax=Okibacterium fritillariae TaxID=123320 RepID=UPI004055393D